MSSKLLTESLIFPISVSDSGATMNGLYAIVYASGEIRASKFKRLTTMCQMDLTEFPFDTQKCRITFMSTIHSCKSLIKK